MTLILIPTAAKYCQQLGFWSARGVACAAPSFFLAAQSGYSSRPEIAAMIAGLVTVIVGIAWINGLPCHLASETRSWGSALRLAANLRTLLAMFFLPALWLDMCTAMIAISAIHGLGGTDHLHAGHGESFGWTYLTTLIQGALIAGTIGLLALLLWPVVIWRRRAAKK